ncbi:Asp23/Gls24 family envelope stress response protein [Pseudonocardia spinosispora]|uniref:Asp23/Gls24 family envelope stress response protein n=1 Tax=Pseudonocardia spinosispora TaxID=103441 RepID=UPI000408CF33|nr:Asp23/Gls24 family envelope stress response protein [Pseudonocardia spinosispora]
MALERTRGGHLLPCERYVEDVLDELDTGRLSPHTQDCPHCATALRGIEALHDATQTLLADPAEPPVGLLDQIMSAVRAEVRRGDALALPTTRRNAEISTRAVASLLRFAADTVPGVRARHCHIVPGDRADTVDIDMSLSVRYGNTVEVLVAEVRDRVTAAMSANIGLRVGDIDIDVVDLWDEESG